MGCYLLLLRKVVLSEDVDHKDGVDDNDDKVDGDDDDEMSL